MFLFPQRWKILVHAAMASVATLISYAVGLKWFVGETLIEQMFDNGDVIEQCEVRQTDGSTTLVTNEDCISDGLRLARTMAFATVVLCEALRGLTVRQPESIFHSLFSNKILIFTMLGSVGVSAVLVFAPYARALFGFEGTELQWWAWLFAIMLAVSSVLVDEILKSFLRSKDENDAKFNALQESLHDVLQEMRQMRHFMYEVHEKDQNDAQAN